MDPKIIYQEINVIKLGVEDLKKCMALDQNTIGGIWTIHHWQKELTDNRRLCMGCFKGKELLGLASGWLAIEEIHITLILVNPLYQGLGIGKTILKSLLMESKKKGAEKAILEVKDSNTSAKAFYESLNFKKIHCRSKLYKDGSNAIIYERSTNIS